MKKKIENIVSLIEDWCKKKLVFASTLLPFGTVRLACLQNSTFAIRTKPTRKPKIAKELALLAPRIDTFCHLESVDNKTNKK